MSPRLDCSDATASPPRRNLLIVLTHGLRSDALSDEGRWPLKTPHLEDLSRHGLRLVAKSACTADPGAMVSLVSGLHARQHGCLDEGDPAGALPETLPAVLRSAGYHVAGVGEVGWFRHQLDSVAEVASVSDPEPAACRYLREASARGHRPMLVNQRRQRLRCGPFEPDRLMLEPDHDIDGFIATEAVEQLEKLPSDRPWALIVVFTGPANELPPPAMYDRLVSPGDVHGGFSPADLSGVDALADPVYPRYQLQNLDLGRIGRLRTDYLGRVSLIDHGVGRIVDVLDGRPDAERTWRCVASDRGTLLGEHGLVGHRSFLSGGLETPVMIAPPPGKPVRGDLTADGLFSTVDVTATLAALAGADAPAHWPGRSLLPLFTGEPVLPEARGVLCEFQQRVMIETRQHKAVFRSKNAATLGCYDLLADPAEKRNLLEIDAVDPPLEALRARLAEVLLPLRAASVPTSGAAVPGPSSAAPDTHYG